MAELRVCHLVPSFLSGDGPSSGILAQIRNQDSTKIVSEIWSLYPPPPGRTAHLEPSVRLRCFGMRSFVDAAILPSLIREMRAARFDVLHCHLVRANLYGRFAGRAAGVPLILSTLRNVEQYMQGRGPGAMAVRQVERLTQRLVWRYVAVSETVRRAGIDLLGISPDRILTIMNAIEIPPVLSAHSQRSAREALNLPQDAFVVGSVGRLHEQKNFDLLVRVAAKLVSTVPNLRVVIVGEGERRPQLEEAIRSRGMDRIFQLPGHVSEVRTWLSAMDVFVSTSRYEGVPRAMMEAMAAGKPVVATAAGGNAELVENERCGFIVEASEAAIAAKIELLYGNTGARETFGKEARLRIEQRFGARRMANEYSQLYASGVAAVTKRRDRDGRREHDGTQ